MKKFQSLKYHDSAHMHVTGESEYVDDRPIMRHELRTYFIHSRSRQDKKLNLKPIYEDPDIVEAFTGEDFAHNRWGTIFKDQPILAPKRSNLPGSQLLQLLQRHSKQLSMLNKELKLNTKIYQQFSLFNRRRKKSHLSRTLVISVVVIGKLLWKARINLRDVLRFKVLIIFI